jgi:N-acetylmuramoyl-L-alanine amidase
VGSAERKARQGFDPGFWLARKKPMPMTMNAFHRSAAGNSRLGGTSGALKLLLAALALTGAAGCPEQEPRVIQNPPPPIHWPPKPGNNVEPPPPAPANTNLTGKRIMIDPGHGGHDVGAWKNTRSRLPEKSIVVDIGNSVARILQARGAQVVCTRSSDVFLSLEQRADSADKYRVNLFMSIHADSAPRNPAASGTEVHVFDNASGDSLTAARCMINAIKRAGLECRGMQRSNFHVLREHSRPAMLIECGFLTNVGDARELNDPRYRARLAAAIADGATEFLCRR